MTISSASLIMAAPFPLFMNLSGVVMDAGYLYFGVTDLNPETNPITVYWDAEGAIPAAQPVRTLNGVPSRNGSPGRLYTTATDCSITVKDSKGRLVFSVPSNNIFTASTLPYTPQGVGAVTRTIPSKLDEEVTSFNFMTEDQIAEAVAVFSVPSAALREALNTGINYVGTRHQRGTFRFVAANYEILGNAGEGLVVPGLMNVKGDGGFYSDNFGGSNYGTTIAATDCDGMRLTANGQARTIATFKDFTVQNASGFNFAALTTIGQTAIVGGWRFENLRLMDFNEGLVLEWAENPNIIGLTINCRKGIRLAGAGKSVIGATLLGNTLRGNVNAAIGNAECIGIDVSGGVSEDLSIIANEVNGFETCMKFAVGAGVTVAGGASLGYKYGFDIGAVANGMTIRDFYMDMREDVTSLAMIWFRPQGTVLRSKNNVKDCNFITGSGAVNCIGVLINDVGQSGAEHVTISGSIFAGLEQADIYAFNPGKLTIENNFCRSRAAVHAIYIGPVSNATPGGGAPVLIDKNECYGPITIANPADITDGKVVLGHNTAKGGDFSGTMVGNVLTVNAVGTVPFFEPGQYFTGAGVPDDAIILSNGTGVGGVGTYNVNAAANVGPITMTMRNVPDWHGKFIPVLNGFTFGGPGTYAATGKWLRDGNSVQVEIQISLTGGTTIASVAGVSSVSGIPAILTPSGIVMVEIFNLTSFLSYGVGSSANGDTVINTPVWAASAANATIFLTGNYQL